MCSGEISRPYFVLLKPMALTGSALALSLTLACGGGGSGSGGVDDDGDGNQVPPGSVTDLTLTGVTPRTASLRWTAPATEGGAGLVFEYDLRIAAVPVTDSTWQDATQVANEPPPLPPGMVQTMTVDDLVPDSTYHFALKSRNDDGAWSSLSNPVSATLPAETEVVFPDAALESLIRAVIQKPDGPIYPDDLTGILEIEAEGLGIGDLTGLVACTHVWRLNAPSNNVSSLAPLVGMTSLRTLGLADNLLADLAPLAGLSGLTQLGVPQNQIADLSPLAALANLAALNCAENQVSSLTPLAGLVQLNYLYLNGNQISDLHPLSGLNLLSEFYAAVNQIVDLTPLQGLTNLQYVVLDFNQIHDLAPLVANQGIGSGDTIRLSGNPLSVTALDVQIPALQARGATVIW